MKSMMGITKEEMKVVKSTTRKTKMFLMSRKHKKRIHMMSM